MQINTATSNGTKTTAILGGCVVVSFTGATINSNYLPTTVDIGMPQQTEIGLPYGRYEFSSNQPSLSFPEKEQTSVSPKLMINMFDNGIRTLLTMLSTGSDADMDTEIEQVQIILAELNNSLRESLLVFASDTEYPEDYLRENSLNELITKLEAAEQLAKPSNNRTLRKALAQSRSLAVRSQKMIDQRLIIPEVFEGRAPAEGLKALADMTTKRLQQMAD